MQATILKLTLENRKMREELGEDRVAAILSTSTEPAK